MPSFFVEFFKLHKDIGNGRVLEGGRDRGMFLFKMTLATCCCAEDIKRSFCCAFLAS